MTAKSREQLSTASLQCCVYRGESVLGPRGGGFEGTGHSKAALQGAGSHLIELHCNRAQGSLAKQWMFTKV